MARILTLFVSFVLFGFCSPTWAGEFETKIAPMLERMEDGNEVFLISRRSKDGMEMLVSKPYRSEDPEAVMVFNPSISTAKRLDFRFGFLYAMGESEPMAVLARWDFLTGKITVLEDEWLFVGDMPSEVESALKSSSTQYLFPKIPNAEPTSAKTTLSAVYQTLLAKENPRVDMLEFPTKQIAFHPYPLPAYGYGDRSFASFENSGESKVSRMAITGIDCKKRSMAVIGVFNLNSSMPKTDEEFRKAVAKAGLKPKEVLIEEYAKPFVKDFCSR